MLGTERIKDRKYWEEVGLGIIMFEDRKAFKVKWGLRTERIRYIRVEDRWGQLRLRTDWDN